MAKLVKTSGEILEVQPLNKKSFTLSELQSYVGGYIEMVNLPNGECMICNEEGLLLNLPYNEIATDLVARLYDTQTQDFAGDVLFINQSEIN